MHWSRLWFLDLVVDFAGVAVFLVAFVFNFLAVRYSFLGVSGFSSIWANFCLLKI